MVIEMVLGLRQYDLYVERQGKEQRQGKENLVSLLSSPLFESTHRLLCTLLDP
jgi:hypothetical protein